MFQKIIHKINRALAPFMFLLFRIFPIKKNKIVIINYSGKGFGDNAKYIANELLKEKKYDIVWSTSNREGLPKQIRNVNINSLKWIYELATAKIWINNSRFKTYVLKRKNQYYIQTWHSSIRLKKIELDVKEQLEPYYIKMIEKDSKITDLMISGCDYSYDTYRRAFQYKGDIAKIGTPRFDLFFNKAEMKKASDKVRKYYKIGANKRIILYAPTFRTWGDTTKSPLNISEFEKYLKDNDILMVRSHPNKTIKFEEKKDKIINATSYPDMQELICAANFLITDFSGCCFDMMITRKPCVLFAPDLEEYLKRERALYFDFKEMPFPLVMTEKELKNEILDFDEKKYNNEINKFYKSINMYEDGNASKKLVAIINEICNK